MADTTSRNGVSELKALFLTTHKVKGGTFFNSKLYDYVKSEGFVAHTASFRDPDVTVEFICQYSCVTLLSASDYNNEIEDFRAFIQNVLIPAQQNKPDMKVQNGPEGLLWNCDKVYLRDLKDAGFPVPKTEFVPPSQSIEQLKQAIASFTPSGSPVVLKPSVSVSAKNTRLIRTPTAYTQDDEAFLASLKDIGPGRSMLIQEFIPSIENGEYSILLINGQLKYAWLKKPVNGDFRCQSDYGGVYTLVLEPEIPQGALKVARELHQWLANRFGYESMAYARVDGIVLGDGKFLLMEVELIEPALGLTLNKPEHLGTDVICRELFGIP